MLSKNFDSYRSLQQRFCMHIEDLKFFDILVYLSQTEILSNHFGNILSAPKS